MNNCLPQLKSKLFKLRKRSGHAHHASLVMSQQLIFCICWLFAEASGVSHALELDRCGIQGPNPPTSLPPEHFRRQLVSTSAELASSGLWAKDSCPLLGHREPERGYPRTQSFPWSTNSHGCGASAGKGGAVDGSTNPRGCPWGMSLWATAAPPPLTSCDPHSPAPLRLGRLALPCLWRCPAPCLPLPRMRAVLASCSMVCLRFLLFLDCYIDAFVLNMYKIVNIHIFPLV